MKLGILSVLIENDDLHKRFYGWNIIINDYAKGEFRAHILVCFEPTSRKIWRIDLSLAQLSRSLFLLFEKLHHIVFGAQDFYIIGYL